MTFRTGDSLDPVETLFILATAATRLAAAWIALRLYRNMRETRFAIVAFAVGVSAMFPLGDLVDSDRLLVVQWLQNAANGLAVLLTALILVRTLTDLYEAYEKIQASNAILDLKVKERTAELSDANISLANEVSERVKAEQALRQSEAALRESEAELRKLAALLIAAQEDERRRLARELHDDTSQTLAALAIELASLQRKAAGADDGVRNGLQSVETSVHRLAEGIHDMSRLLHPSILDDLGLEAAVRTECERVSEREGIPIIFEVLDLPSELPRDCALTLYRITQEALHNIAKHAEATRAHVLLQGEDDRVTLEIEDAGKGFDPLEARQTSGLGLISMGERVRLLGGVLRVDSKPGSGARIRVEAPLERSTHAEAASLAC
jgi:signal transduction histidine kinase